MSESGGDDLKDYTTYSYSRRERIWYGALGMAGSFGLLYLFFHSLWICLPGSLAGAVFFLAYQKRQLVQKEKWKLMTEFKDAMDSMISALVAGYSMENAITEAYHDLQLMYGEETLMLSELKNIRQKLQLKQALDLLLLDLGRRSGLEDIIVFAQIYTTARRSGGNLVKVMKRTADNIGEKIEIQREIQTMIAGKKMEATCMMIIPLLIILYLQIFSPGYLEPLYQGAGGRLFMAAALVIYGAAVIWSRKIMNIQN